MERRTHKNWAIVTFVVITVLGFSLSKAGEVKTFEIKAENYKYNPDTITVNMGDKVIIRAIAMDKDHGFGIKAFRINSLLPKGKWVTIEFTPDKKGEFLISCTKFCGWKHSKMIAKLIVE